MDTAATTATTFAARLHTRMNSSRRRLSIAHLVRETGISRASIHRYLRGSHVPSVRSLGILANAIDASMGCADTYDYLKNSSEFSRPKHIDKVSHS